MIICSFPAPLHNTSLYLLGDDVSFPLQWCGCERSLRPSLSLGNRVTPLGETTCSRDAHHRGAGQKVVSFSFYRSPRLDQPGRNYLDGVSANLALAASLYPGWVVRLYHDLDPGDPAAARLCSVACTDTRLDLCDIRHLPGPLGNSTAAAMFPMNWRFLPTLDPQVAAFVSRDLDSRLSAREAAAVSAWLASSRSFHMMRDHPQHGTEMLGGAWGWRDTGGGRGRWREAWDRILADQATWAGRDNWQTDQYILRR